jgi:hypothetical protein
MKATENSAAGLCRKEEPEEAARPPQEGWGLKLIPEEVLLLRKHSLKRVTENSAADPCRKEEPEGAARPRQAGQEPKRPAPERKVLCLTKSVNSQPVAASHALASRKKGCILQTVY